MTTLAKRQKIWNLLRCEPDILLLIDTRTKEHDLLAYGGNKRSVFSTDTDYRGLAFIIKKCYEPEKIETDSESGNMITLTFKLAGKKHGLIGIYRPCEDNPQFFSSKVNDTIKKLKKLGSSEIILVGDMNMQLGKKFGYEDKTLRKKAALEKISAEHCLNDHVTEIATLTNTSPISFWRKNTEERSTQLNEKYQTSRLDHVLSTYPSANIYTKYTRFYPSDHAINETCIKIEVALRPNPMAGKLGVHQRRNPREKDQKDGQETHQQSKQSEFKANNVQTKYQYPERNNPKKIAINKWTSLVNFTKKITSVWARDKAAKRNNENSKLIRCMNI